MKKKFVENVFYLSIVQAANYLLPLVTFPYLVRVLGAEQYGLMSYAAAFINYFVIITDYGFNLSATRQVAVQRENPERLSSIFRAVLGSKLLLCGLSAIIVSSLVVAVPKFSEHWTLYAVFFGAVIGNVLLPLWFYQGMEQMKFTAIFNLMGKILSAIGIFVLVRRPADLLMAAILQVGSVMVAGAISIPHCIYVYHLKLGWPSFDEVRYQLREGWYVFLSQLSMIIFNNSPMVILGFFAPYQVVGYYAIAQKLTSAAVNIHAPITVSLYPHAGRLFRQSYEQALNLLKRMLWLGAVSFAVLGALIFVLADLLVIVIAGFQIPSIAVALRIMSFMPMMIFIDNIFGAQIMLNTGQQYRFMMALLAGSVASVVASFILIPAFTLYGAATAVVITEIVIIAMVAVPVLSDERMKAIRGTPAFLARAF